MTPTPKSSDITLSEIHSLLPRYEILLHHLSIRDGAKKRKPSDKPSDLLYLDRHRYSEIPSLLQQRKRDSGNAWLEKPEVELLMQWKLKHGKPRPRLTSLIASNPASLIKSTTAHAFATLTTPSPASTSPLPALTHLTTLTGIGPATASLLLSAHSPPTTPFFSDELFRWICWDATTGWARKIKYNVAEYRMLWEGVERVRERLGGAVQAVELEKVAWVVGRGAGDEGLVAVVAGEGGGEGEPPAGKRAKVGGEGGSKARGGDGPEMDAGEKSGEENGGVGDEEVGSMPLNRSDRAKGEENGEGSGRRTSPPRTRTRSGGANKDNQAGVAAGNKRKRKGNSRKSSQA